MRTWRSPNDDVIWPSDPVKLPEGSLKRIEFLTLNPESIMFSRNCSVMRNTRKSVAFQFW